MSIVKVIEARGRARGAVVVAHGLNINPHVFQDFGEFFSGCGLNTAIAELTGHDGRRNSRHLPSAEGWKADMAKALQEGQDLAGGGKLYIVGFSLGGSLAVSLLCSQKDVQVSKMLLIAPALKLRLWTYLPRPLMKLARMNIPLPSGLPKRYRASKVTSIKWYEALFKICAELEQPADRSALSRIPTRVVLAKRDEFMHPKHIEAWIAENKLVNWEVQIIPGKSIFSMLPQHLIIDKHSLGTKRWRQMTSALAEFFELESR